MDIRGNNGSNLGRYGGNPMTTPKTTELVKILATAIVGAHDDWSRYAQFQEQAVQAIQALITSSNRTAVIAELGKVQDSMFKDQDVYKYTKKRVKQLTATLDKEDK